MSQQAALYTQVHPPTAVTHCTAAWLTRPAAALSDSGDAAAGAPALPDLVLVRSTQLELYSVRCAAGAGLAAALGVGGAPAGAAPTPPPALELMHSCSLFGVAESVAVLRARAPGQRDALLLTFRDAKLSVLHWDAGAHVLAPTSLHYFEGDASLKQGRTAFPYPPLAVTDPLGRCGAVLMLRHQLAVLPAIDSELLALGIAGDTLEGHAAGGPTAGAAQGGTTAAAAGGRAGGAVGAAAAAAVGNSYVDNLGKAGIKEVRDAVFLHGYNEAVLAVLHEVEPTWAGNLRQKHDTCALACLSLNLTRKQHPRIWGATQLPSDATRLSAVPSGGVLVLCQHLVLYYRQGQATGVVLHPSALPPAAPPPPLRFDAQAMAEAGGPGPAAAQYAEKHALDVHPETVPAAVQFCDSSQAAELKVTADGSCVAWLAPDSAMLCLRSGQLLQLAVLTQPGTGGDRRLAVARAGAAPPASCACSLTGDGGAALQGGEQHAALLFLGSAAGDSLLISSATAAAAKPAAGTKRPAAEEAAAADEGAEEAGPAGFDRSASKRMRLESIEEVAGGAGAAGGEGAGQQQQRRQQQEQQDPPAPQQDAAQPPAAAAAAPGDYDSEDEEALIYGTALIAPAGAASAAVPAATAAPVAPPQQLRRYQLRVLDSLANMGPVRDFALTDAAAAGASDTSPCLVACSGEGKGGTLTVLRRSVLPDVITEVPLPGLLGAWAVHYRPAEAAAEGAAEGGGAAPAPAHHAYLLLSFQGATKVLATGEELREVTETVEFAVDTPTLAAGSLCGGRRIAQIFPQGVRLLDGEESAQDVWAHELAGAAAHPGASGPSILAAHVLDPYVAVLLSDGSAALLAVDAGSSRLAPLAAAAAPEAAAALRPSAAEDHVTACSLFRDASGWLQRHAQDVAQPAASQQAGGGGGGGGDSYCLLARASGACQLYSLPGWQLTWQCADLAEGPALLQHSSSGAGPTLDADDGPPPALVEARLLSFGPAAAGRGDPGAARASRAPACEAPMLLALTADHQLLVYKAFTAAGGSGPTLRFRRLRLDLPPLLPPAAGGAHGSAATAAPSWRLPRLHSFEGLGEEAPFSGVFVAGLHPHWLVAARGTLLPHPHHQPPAAPGVAGFTPFHNLNCPFGFIAATSGARSGIQISQLPAKTRLDAPWPRQRIAVKGTPLKVAHYAEADLYAVLSSRQVPFKPFLPEEEEPGEPQASYSYALAQAAAKGRGVMQGHELRLVWPGGGWQAVWRHQLLPGEKALSVAAVRLKDQSSGATVPLLAVGAGLPAGEDYPCGGRLLLFEVTRGEGGGEGGWAGRLIYTREFRGPITALSSLEGYLLLASGNRIETCALSSTSTASNAEDGTLTTTTMWRLTRSAFYDGPMLLTGLQVVKNFVLLGDVAHSVQFVRYKEEGRQLSLLSKDFNRAAVAATQFLINGSSLHLASADASGTLRLLSYLPSHPESWKGQRLVAWGAFHTGDAATAMQRLRLHPPSPEDRTTRQAVLLSTAPGALALLAPLAAAPSAGLDAAAATGALRALQRELALLLPQAAGLNPAAFRRRYASIPPALQGAQCFSRQLALEEQGVLDGDLLAQYLHLPRRQQEGAAEAAGLERGQLLELLQGLWRAGGVLL